MKLLPETRAIISQVEAITDRPVQIVELSDLPVMATMHVARDGSPSHRLACRPEGDVLDYQVATQCANVLRLYQRPPSARFNFGSDRKHVSAIEAMLRDSSASPPDETHLRRVAGVIFDWLLLSLRSNPVSMRIDLWLWEEYPALRPQIELALGRQMQENVTAATKSIDGLSIPPAFRVLPAAYARFTDRLLGSGFYSIPFETMSLMAGGDALLAIWDEMPASPLSDNELIDAWAKQLGILGWYVWLPFHE